MTNKKKKRVWLCVTYMPTIQRSHQENSHHEQAEQHEAIREETGFWEILTKIKALIQKKTSNNVLYSHWSWAQSLPLWISPFNINILVLDKFYK